ncbi:Riboflavin biosynthesis protein RibD domain protein [metagenome]|uniref:Riboflavin biosynthesis protein RibD domain protein n=1 Tax=metagenome TaxID=256318 RepID=A0A2P2BYD3_9ZZZZ
MEMIAGPQVGPLDDQQVLAAYPWPDSGRWVRAMMVTTLDGAAAGPDGLSGSISSEIDKAVFDAVRRLADVVLVGAGTIRAERYGPMVAKPEDAAARADQGSAPAPVLAVVSPSLDLPWDEPMWAASTIRPIVLTLSGSASEERLARAGEHAEVVVLPGESVDPSALLDLLEARGLRRIVCEGGPSLLAAIAAADLLDEADITISPMLVGNAPQTPSFGVPRRFDLAHVISGDGFLMNRYLNRTTP